MNYTDAGTLIAAISSHFLPFRNLNARRIMGIGFLCDWKHCIEFGRPISECNWSITGNWVDSQEFAYALYTSEFLNFQETNSSAIPTMLGKIEYPYLSGCSQDVVCNHVFSVLDKRTDFDLDTIILSTYPFNLSGPVDMVCLSKEYASVFGREYVSKLTA